ncbi:MAG: thiamine-phosphate kinase [Lacipirellulaceae bacterium]
MELSFVDWLRTRVPVPPGVLLGIGDDAALLAPTSGPLVVTSDLLIDGVHFVSAEHSPERIGRKALAVNLSDLAAMGARACGAVLSLALPRGGACGVSSDELARRLVEGMLPLAERFGCPLVGGDTNVGPGPLVVSVTALGEAPSSGAALRSTAQPGDDVLVTGALGGSLLGKHLDFTPRLDEGRVLVERFGVRAMMDVTDGLSIDAHRIARGSGVGIALDLDRVPINSDARVRAGETGKAPLDHALADGEDFELLFTLDPASGERLLAEAPFECGVTRVGVVVAEPGLWRRTAEGLAPLEPRGYEHR